MPVLEAKAIDLDPEGLAFLRRVIRPDFERELAADNAPPEFRGGHANVPCQRMPVQDLVLQPVAVPAE
jgi:hypothetical protein